MLLPLLLTVTGPTGITIGIDGDFYLNVDTNDVYQKRVGVWTLIGNLT